MSDPVTPPSNISATPDPAPGRSDRPFPSMDFNAPPGEGLEVAPDDGEIPVDPAPTERKKPGPKPKEKPAPVATEVEDEPEPEPESEEPESEETDVEEDYDAPVKAKETEVDLDKVTETVARQQAKENGRKVKELSTRLTEFELEKKRVEDELVEARKQIDNFKSVQVDPASHPEYKKIVDSIWTAVEATEDKLPLNGKFELREKFNGYIHEFRAAKALPREERRKALDNLKSQISDHMGNFDSPYDELMEDDRIKADGIISKVMDTVESQAPLTLKLDELRQEIQTKAQKGQLERGVEDYTKQVGSISQVLASIEAIPDDAIEADPYAPESVVAKMVKGDDAQKKRFKNIEKDITEAFIGPRPLTQTELDALEAQGKDLKQFHKERQKQSEAKRTKFVAYLAQHLMTRAEEKGLRKELAELKAKYEGEESELDALDKIKPRKSSKVEDKTEFKGPARERPLPQYSF